MLLLLLLFALLQIIKLIFSSLFGLLSDFIFEKLKTKTQIQIPACTHPDRRVDSLWVGLF